MAGDGPGRLQSGEPSSTAFSVAMRRAAHQLLDDPKVFDDPLALKMIGERGLERLKAEIGARHQTPYGRLMRAYLAARSRYAEDRLGAAYEAGVRQYLVLGAGLDTFAWRNPYPDLEVVEVDHPSTQAWKLARLAASGVEAPATLAFAPVDFQTQTLAEGLAASPFDRAKPAFVSWLGVSMYLDEAAAMHTLDQLAALPAGSETVFDFRVTAESLDPLARVAYEALAARVAASGEPFRSAFDPDAFPGRLSALGFGEVEVLDSAALNRLYFDGRSDGLRLTGPGRIARAAV